MCVLGISHVAWSDLETQPVSSFVPTRRFSLTLKSNSKFGYCQTQEKTVTTIVCATFDPGLYNISVTAGHPSSRSRRRDASSWPSRACSAPLLPWPSVPPRSRASKARQHTAAMPPLLSGLGPIARPFRYARLLLLSQPCECQLASCLPRVLTELLLIHVCVCLCAAQALQQPTWVQVSPPLMAINLPCSANSMRALLGVRLYLQISSSLQNMCRPKRCLNTICVSLAGIHMEIV